MSGGFDASFPFGESLRKDVFPGRTGGTLDLRLKKCCTSVTLPKLLSPPKRKRFALSSMVGMIP